MSSVVDSRIVFQVPQPTTEGAIWAGIVLLALLIAVLILTLGESVYQYRRDRRKDRCRDDVEIGILSRMSEPDPAWDEWVPDLTQPERTVARESLYEYLGTVEGSEKESLVSLAEEMGVVEEAREQLTDGKRHEKLQALGWLTLTETTVEPDTLDKNCTAGDDLRAAAARVLHAADHPEAQSRGSDLLLGDGSLTLTTHGLDTVYRLYESDPEPLLDRAAGSGDEWRPSLVVQVLSVIRHTGLTAQDADWSFVFAHTDHEAPSVRAAAVRALAAPGWDQTFRERVAAEQFVEDPHRNVRRAAYEMLAEWGDEESLQLLAAGILREPDQRSRVRALEFLADVAELTPELLAAGDDIDITIPSGETTQMADARRDTATEVAVDVEVDSGAPPAGDDPRSYDRAVSWVRTSREVTGR